MPVKLSSLKADLGKEREGDWIDIPEWPGVAFQVRGLNFPPYRLAREQLFQRFARRYGKKTPPSEEISTEVGKLYAKHILVNWRGLDVEYSPDTALETLSDPSFREVLAQVEYAAGQIAQVQVDFEEEAEKNSARPSVMS